MRRTIAHAAPQVLLAGVLLFGVACLITGCAQRGDVDDSYRVGFAREGDSCNRYLRVYLDTDTGEPLDCTSFEELAFASVAFSGFTSEQNAEIASLAKRLGAGGLTETEQRRIQDRVDAIAATVPAQSRPYHYTGLWGTGLALTGAGIIVAGLVLFFTLRHRLESLINAMLARWP